ncbi:MAG: hypothetical protein OCC49_15580 [Fibrobacterales bacterium]
MVILLTVVSLLAFILILILTFTYVVTYGSNTATAEEYYAEMERDSIDDFIEDHERFAKESHNNPFITEIPELDRDNLIEFMEKEVQQKKKEASEKAEVASRTMLFSEQIEEILAEEEEGVAG